MTSGSRLLLQEAVPTSDDMVITIIFITLAAATLALLVRAFTNCSSCLSFWGCNPSRNPNRVWPHGGWDAKGRSSAQMSDDVLVDLDTEHCKLVIPAVMHGQAHGMIMNPVPLSESGQPMSGWIRSMRPAQGYTLVQSSNPCTPNAQRSTLALSVSSASDSLMSSCDTQCVTPTKLSPHPELPRIRVVLPSPMLRQKHSTLA